MKIHFCDLCNESVPDGDLKAGKAVLRKGRVICLSCESSMSGDFGEGYPASKAQLNVGDKPSLMSKPGEHAGHAAAARHAEHASTAHHQANSSPSKGGGVLMGSFAIVLVLGLGFYVSGQIGDLKQDQDRQRSSLEGRLRGLGSDLDDSSRRARDRAIELGDELRGEIASATDSAEKGAMTMRAQLAGEIDRIDDLKQELSTLSQGLRESDEDNGKRLDDLVAQASKARDRLMSMDDRLRGTELAVASGGVNGPGGGVVAPVAAPPKYTAELADLASDNAGTRWNAVQALGETGDPAVIAFLVPVLGDPDVFVRMAVARVLGDLAAPEAIEPLINALEDEEAVVREAAMVALHGITGRNFRFDPVATTADRAKKVKAWRSWWKKAREEYFGES